MGAETDQLLKKRDLRSTVTRQQILEIFIKKNYALSYGDIEREVHDHLDRVTVYRTLKTFLDKGLIHKVLDDEGSLKYALCSAPCTTVSHEHDHVHFKCTSCGQTNCLEIEIPAVKLPKGYSPESWNLLIQGVCNICSKH